MEQQHVGANQMSQWVVPPVRPSVVTSYLHKHSKIVGNALVVCGLLSVIFNVVEITTSKPLPRSCYVAVGSVLGHGIWSGILMLVAGIMGLASGISRTRCKITGFMVMSILAACSCLVQLIYGVSTARMAHELWLECNSDVISYPSYYYHSCIDGDRHGLCIKIWTVFAMETLLAITAIIGGISAIWGSSICCKAVCCCSNNRPELYGMPYTTPMAVSIQQNGAQAMFSNYTVHPTAAATGGSIYYQPANGGAHAAINPVFEAPPTYVSKVSQVASEPK